MTPAQAIWLSKNRTFRAAHTTGGMTRFVKRGMLDADGKYVEMIRGRRPAVTADAIEVGVLEMFDPNTKTWRAA